MNSHRVLYVFLIACVLVVAALLSRQYDPARGLPASGVGGLAGVVLCVTSHIMWKRVRAAEGQAMVTAVMGAVALSFFLFSVFLVVTYFVWREALVPASLTALAVYLTHRFAEAIGANRPHEIREAKH